MRIARTQFEPILLGLSPIPSRDRLQERIAAIPIGAFGLGLRANTRSEHPPHDENRQRDHGRKSYTNNEAIRRCPEIRRTEAQQNQASEKEYPGCQRSHKQIDRTSRLMPRFLPVREHLADVVVQHEHHNHHQEDEAQLEHGLFDLRAHITPDDHLDEQKQQHAAIENRDRQ